MIEIDFKVFCVQEYSSDEYHQLYVLLNGVGEVLYVGITRRNIWERWFGFGGHMIYDGRRFLGLSAVGAKIEDHLPDSLKWKIQLWTLEDCIAYCKASLPSASQGVTIESIEPFMIQRLSPSLNVTYNLTPGIDTMPKSNKELKRENLLDDAYKKIFEKDE